MNALPWTIYVSFAGAALLLALGRASPGAARGVALATALAGAAAGALGALGFAAQPGLQTLVDTPWVAGLGIRYHLAADGISIVLVLLTGLAATAGVLFSWNVGERVAEFFALYFLLIGGVYGVFLSADAFLLFIFYEIAIVPKYFLIAGWGSTNREYAAMKLVLYSFAGSALVLAGLLWAHAAGGEWPARRRRRRSPRGPRRPRQQQQQRPHPALRLLHQQQWRTGPGHWPWRARRHARGGRHGRCREAVGAAAATRRLRRACSR